MDLAAIYVRKSTIGDVRVLKMTGICCAWWVGFGSYTIKPWFDRVQ